ncbi:MAG: hypothetical protein JHD16_05645, partial [Solirubrobacteraceae bacterium]|nr:hypothetical protein [Solirubrobacteraceae bacterium]
MTPRVGHGDASGEAGAADTPKQQAERRSVLRRLRRLSLAGALLGTAAIWASGLPSLVPRPWFIQAVGAGLSLVIAYGVGAFFGWVYRSLGLPVLPARARKQVWQGLAIVAPIGVLITGWLGRGWQSDQRELIGMDPSVPLLWVAGSVLGVLVALLLLASSRGIVWVGRRVSALLGKVLPARLGVVIGVAATVVVTWSIT